MSESNSFRFSDFSRMLAISIIPVILAGIVMILAGLIFFAIPNVCFDAANPSILYIGFYIAIILLIVGILFCFFASRPALAFAKRVNVIALDWKMLLRASPPQASEQGEKKAGGFIRPPLVKKEAAEATMVVAQKPAPRPAPVATTAPAAHLVAAQQPEEISMPASSGKPADMGEVESAVNTLVEKYNNPDVRTKFDGWQNTLVLSFPDIDRSYMLKINGSESIEVSQGMDETAAIQVTMASDMFVKLLTKQINAIKAYSSGALKVKGEMKNLLKLRKLMF
ncbi:MAG TPA: SCP2 sterol-binding domain-containing protein [Candidatus Lokiarchaeia archaeon]|nr:SCP2 sterol-binding domain-containing protein [Candidatus Lokiarchaeia archaeon]